MINRREFLAAAVTAPGAAAMVESTGAAGAASIMDAAVADHDRNAAAEQLTALPPGTVKVGGEMGRRIDVTVTNNLLVIDVENDFLKQV